MSEGDVAQNGKESDGRKAYRSDDIQGDVLPGFRSRRHQTFHQTFFMARIAGNADEARDGLRLLLDDRVISTGRDVWDGSRGARTPAFVNVAFTARGLERLGRPIGNAVLRSGLAGRSVGRKLLGDPGGWRIGGPGPGVDMVVNIGSTGLKPVTDKADLVRKLLGPAWVVDDEVDGALLHEGREHFGFRDGLAQPFISDDPAPRAGGKEAEGAVWPNWKALGLAAEAEQAAVRADEAQTELKVATEEWQAAVEQAGSQRVPVAIEERMAAAAAAANLLTAKADDKRRAAMREASNKIEMRRPGVPIRPTKQVVVRDGDEFTANGSYMVWLQLEQRPAEFWAACRELASGVEKAFGGSVDEEAAAAMLVGRHIDGIPLASHTDGEIEDFSYFTDRAGRACPAGAHIRLTNPRDVETADAMVLRRGIPYGAQAADRNTRDGVERGLIFVCYQADIEHQYEMLQGTFSNASYETGQPSSRFPDAVISQRGRDGSTVEIASPSGRGSFGMRLHNTWVVPHGGLYLFVPSMAALRTLCGAASREPVASGGPR
jgi:deferrochelatase/peroxidase EfeB